MSRMLRVFLFLFPLWIVSGSNAVAGEQDPGFTIRPHHVGISVPDLEESIAWYGEMLGFKVVRRMEKAENPEMIFALLRRGDCYIELFQVAGGRPMPEYRRDPTADLYVHGTKHIAFQVEDARAAVKTLQAKGVEIALGPVESPRAIFVFIRDNSGNTFELIQFREPGPLES